MLKKSIWYYFLQKWMPFSILWQYLQVLHLQVKTFFKYTRKYYHNTYEYCHNTCEYTGILIIRSIHLPQTDNVKSLMKSRQDLIHSNSDGSNLFYQTSSELKHHFSNIELLKRAFPRFTKLLIKQTQTSFFRTSNELPKVQEW